MIHYCSMIFIIVFIQEIHIQGLYNYETLQFCMLLYTKKQLLIKYTVLLLILNLFSLQDIDGKALLLLSTDVMVKFMRIKVGVAVKLGSYIQKLKERENCSPQKKLQNFKCSHKILLNAQLTSYVYLFLFWRRFS